MSTYIHFTEEEIERASHTDIEQLLRREGERLKRSGSEYEWHDGYGKVTVRGHKWYHQYEGKGGDAISFVQRYFNKTFPEAMEYLLGEERAVVPITKTEGRQKEKLPFELPPKHDNMRRVYAYLLNRRKIDKEILYAFIKEGMIYESADYHNAVFVGFDQNGKSVHAHKRSTASESTYRGNAVGVLAEYSFHWHGTSEKLYVFEAPIDMLSYITMHKDCWRSQSYAACCGVADMVLFQMMQDNPNIKNIYLCLDNDEGGYKATKRISKKLQERGIPYEILIPKTKDWNQDLIQAEEVEEESKCRTMLSC